MESEGDWILSWSLDGHLRFWDADRTYALCAGHTTRVNGARIVKCALNEEKPRRFDSSWSKEKADRMLALNKGSVLSWSDDNMLLQWHPATGSPSRAFSAPLDWRAADSDIAEAFPFLRPLHHTLQLHSSLVHACADVVVSRVGRRLCITRFIAQAATFDERGLPPIKLYSPAPEVVDLFNRTRRLLTPREEELMRNGLGITERDEPTANDVRQDSEVTRERIRQIEAKALRKLSDPSRVKQLRALIDDEDKCRLSRSPTACAPRSFVTRPARSLGLRARLRGAELMTESERPARSRGSAGLSG